MYYTFFCTYCTAKFVLKEKKHALKQNKRVEESNKH